MQAMRPKTGCRCGVKTADRLPMGLALMTLLGRVLICGRPAKCKRFLKKIGT